MDDEIKKEIYTKWKVLEKECELEVHDVVPNQKITPQTLDLNKMMELSKYRKWMHAYCLDILDPSEKYQIIGDPENDSIKCTCDNLVCAKCLLVNCKDDDCYFHPLTKKIEFRKRYSNR